MNSQLVKQAYDKYHKYDRRYKYKKKLTNNPVSQFEQDEANCWLYSSCNDTYFNTNILVDVNKVKQKLLSWDIDVTKGLHSIHGCLAICDTYQEHHFITRELNVLKDTKLFAEMLKAGYWFVYSRYHNVEFAKDVRTDDIVNEVIQMTSGRHATCIGFLNLLLWENGSWSKDSALNNFSYKDTNIFLASVRAGGIDPVVRFIDIDPAFRK